MTPISRGTLLRGKNIKKVKRAVKSLGESQINVGRDYFGNVENALCMRGHSWEEIDNALQHEGCYFVDYWMVEEQRENDNCEEWV